MPGIPLKNQPMTDNQSEKARLRRELRQARRRIDAPARASASMEISEHCQHLPGWPDARRIALYLAADAEVDPAPLAAAARTAGKMPYSPVIQPDDSLCFARWLEGEALAANRYGIPEPGIDAERCEAAALDIILLPLVGWDRSGTRLGMGGGFYDRSLAGVRGPLRVGLAYASQERPALPSEPWDARLDYVATEVALVACPSSD